MKRKVRTRVLSAALTLVMLASLMPAAFAASYNDYMTEYVDLDDYLDWSDTDFDDTDLYDNTYYIEITSKDNYAPYVLYSSNDRNAEGVFIDYDEDIYFDADSDYTEDGEYDYEIDCYNKKETYIGTILLTLIVGDGEDSNSTDGDIYALSLIHI